MKLLKLLQFVCGHPLNKGGVASALMRIFRWQLATRLMPGSISFPFVDGTRLLASRGMAGATGNWYCGLHELSEMGFILHLLRPGDLFLDVGANIGSYTILAAGAARAQVISVEPVPSTAKVLKNNVTLNDLEDRVVLHVAGLSQCSGKLVFSSSLDTVNHVMASGEDGPCIEVPVVTMDDLLNGVAPRVIKIDVEGYEKCVLDGGQKTLADPRVSAVVMELNGSGRRYGVGDEEIVSEMKRHGFEPWSYDALRRVLGSWDVRSQNAIFVRDRDEIQRFLTEAKKYVLVNGEV